jgi:hypothetical protein
VQIEVLDDRPFPPRDAARVDPRQLLLLSAVAK